MPGQYFAPHCDGRYARPGTHPHAGDCSQITIQLYLHDVPVKNGGATTFLDYTQSKRKPYQPSTGSALIFSQNLFHEGSRLLRGFKYTMRTEAMYQKMMPTKSHKKNNKE